MFLHGILLIRSFQNVTVTAQHATSSRVVFEIFLHILSYPIPSYADHILTKPSTLIGKLDQLPTGSIKVE